MKKTPTPEELQQILTEADLIFDNNAIQQALDEMASAINQRLAHTPTLVLCVVVGGIIPAGQLLPRLSIPLQLDYIHATRYRGATSGSEIHWLKEPVVDLNDKTILIIDDILDEGITLQAIVHYCQERGAKDILTAALVQKEMSQRKGLATVDFCGLTAPNRYLFGYGMDYQEQLRHVAGIYAVKGL